MKCDEVRLGPHVREVHELNAKLGGGILGQGRVEADDLHAVTEVKGWEGREGRGVVR